MLVPVALLCVMSQAVEAASLTKLLARGYRIVAGSPDETSLLLTRRGEGLYVFDQAGESLHVLTLRGGPGYGASEPLERPPVALADLQETIRVAAEEAARAIADQLVPLRKELASLAPTARIERGATTLYVEARDPEHLIEIVGRVGRGEGLSGGTRSMLDECSWSGCVAPDRLSVSADCGLTRVDFATAGEFALTLGDGGRSASIALSDEGLTLRHQRGPQGSAVTLAADR
jgi:hypothetical protein